MRYVPPRSFLLIALLMLLIAACDMGGQPSATPTPPPTPTPTPTPAERTSQIAKAMLSVNSFHFAIKAEGAPIATDETGAFTIMNIEGDLQRPANVQAIVRVRGGGALIDIRTVALADQQYLTNPITRQWQCAPPGSLFNPAVLFDPDQGIEHLLQNEFQNVELVGTEQIDGSTQLHLRGTLDGPPLMAISANSIGFGTVQADLWADASTLQISKLELVDPATNATDPTKLTMTFSDYNKSLDIREPPEAQC
jgi:lipoprotein LprG